MLLPKSFYTRTDVVQVARDLLGMYLITRIEGVQTAGLITETEAYRAPDDRACHAYGNRLTDRTRVMFETGGVAYIYLCYGIHHLFNVVTAVEGMAHAVLVRAIEPVENVEIMLKRRGIPQIAPRLTAGPGALSQALGLHRRFSGVSLLRAEGPVWIEDRGFRVEPDQILAGPRVGVESAGDCARWEWRFRIRDSKWTSKPN